ncbi:MAG: PASTA domain-containing protein, partial [Actinomycetota bacterium]
GPVLGSAQYMAPEQASGAPVTAAADVYSAGIVLYEMLTGSVPFTGESALAVALRHVSDDIPSPSRINAAVPRDLDRAVTRATAKDPAQRPAAAELAAALRGEAPEATAPLPAGPAEAIAPAGTETTVWPIPGATYDPSRLGARVLVVAGILALLSAGVWLWLLTKPDERRERSTAAERPPALATEPAERTSQPYELEDFTGWSFADASAELRKRGLEVRRADTTSDAPPDDVLGSVPPPGTVMSEGETVTLSVSTGPPEEPEEEEELEEDEEEAPGNSGSAPGHSKDKGKDKD